MYPPKLFTPIEALTFSLLLTFIFVGSFYVFLSKSERMLNRNLPWVIKRRFQAVFMTCGLATVALGGLMWWRSGGNKVNSLLN